MRVHNSYRIAHRDSLLSCNSDNLDFNSDDFSQTRSQIHGKVRGRLYQLAKSDVRRAGVVAELLIDMEQRYLIPDAIT